jgi:hypothetical protein
VQAASICVSDWAGRSGNAGRGLLRFLFCAVLDLRRKWYVWNVFARAVATAAGQGCRVGGRCEASGRCAYPRRASCTAAATPGYVPYFLLSRPLCEAARLATIVVQIWVYEPLCYVSILPPFDLVDDVHETRALATDPCLPTIWLPFELSQVTSLKTVLSNISVGRNASHALRVSCTQVTLHGCGYGNLGSDPEPRYTSPLYGSTVTCSIAQEVYAERYLRLTIYRLLPCAEAMRIRWPQYSDCKHASYSSRRS